MVCARDFDTARGSGLRIKVRYIHANETRKFAKTRFVVNAGLAAGAFKR
jgi:hypothetical protein